MTTEPHHAWDAHCDRIARDEAAIAAEHGSFDDVADDAAEKLRPADRLFAAIYAVCETETDFDMADEACCAVWEGSVDHLPIDWKAIRAHEIDFLDLADVFSLLGIHKYLDRKAAQERARRQAHNVQS